MSCENLMIVNSEARNALNPVDFLLTIYEQGSASICSQDASTYKFKTDFPPPKQKFAEESVKHPSVKFIVSFFYVNNSCYNIGYFVVQNGQFLQERDWDSEKKNEDGLLFAVKFVSRFYPLLLKEIFGKVNLAKEC